MPLIRVDVCYQNGSSAWTMERVISSCMASHYVKSYAFAACEERSRHFGGWRLCCGFNMNWGYCGGTFRIHRRLFHVPGRS